MTGWAVARHLVASHDQHGRRMRRSGRAAGAHRRSLPARLQDGSRQGDAAHGDGREALLRPLGLFYRFAERWRMSASPGTARRSSMAASLPPLRLPVDAARNRRRVDRSRLCGRPVTSGENGIMSLAGVAQAIADPEASAECGQRRIDEPQLSHTPSSPTRPIRWRPRFGSGGHDGARPASASRAYHRP